MQGKASALPAVFPSPTGLVSHSSEVRLSFSDLGSGAQLRHCEVVLGTRPVRLPLLGLTPHPIPGPFVVVDPAPKLSLGLRSSAWLDYVGVSCTPSACPEWWFLPERRAPSTTTTPILCGSKRLGRPQRYLLSCSLPEYFVVPSSLADQDLKIFSHSFVGRRMPVSGGGWGCPCLPPVPTSTMGCSGSLCSPALELEPCQRQCPGADGPGQGCPTAAQDRPAVSSLARRRRRGSLVCGAQAGPDSSATVAVT